MGLLTKLTKQLKANKELIDIIANIRKKFTSSKSYWSVSYLILLFTIREAIAWKFGSAIKTFCETQALDSSFPTLWSLLGFVFDVGGSLELVLLGTFIFLVLSLVKFKSTDSSEVIDVVREESKETNKQLEEIKKLMKTISVGDEEEFLQKYFGENYKLIVENPQTYHNFTKI